ncbi:MAG: transcriptional repressor LexA [Chloroflexi bacterium]|nr:transcriptional repressor LexA [Chloroflexota bacterium]
MDGELTEKQERALRLLREMYDAQGRSPSYTELAQAMGISTTAAFAHVVALEKKGWLRRKRRARGIEVLPPPVQPAPLPPGVARLPVVGEIAAGQPIDARQDLGEYLQVESSLVRGDGCYALRVRGQSMIGDGIHDGDIIIVQPQSTAENGDTVVALLEGDKVTLKRYYREKDFVRLQPANPYLEPMFVRDLVIQGKVVALIRRFS